MVINPQSKLLPEMNHKKAHSSSKSLVKFTTDNFSLAFDIISLVKLTNDSDKSKHFNVVMDIVASHETEEIINCIYQSSEIESDKGSIVAEKPSDVCNDSDPNELETDKV